MAEAVKDGSVPATEDVVALAYFRTLLGKQAVIERQQLDLLLASMTTPAPLIVPTFWKEMLPEGQRKKLVDAERRRIRDTVEARSIQFFMEGEQAKELTRAADEATKLWVYPPPMMAPQKKGLLSRIFG